MWNPSRFSSGLCFAYAVMVQSAVTSSLFAAEKLDVEPTIAEVKSSSASDFEITYKWKVGATPKKDWTVYVHFTDANGEIKFQDDHDPTTGCSGWKVGEYKQGPNSISIPDNLTGTFEIRMGLYDQGSGDRAELNGKNDSELRVIVGKLKVGNGKVVFEPIAKP